MGVDVSVVLLTYNHEPFIAEAIESVLDQRTSAAIEILITEDCSTDGTRSVVERYARRHPERIRTFLSERNLNSNEVVRRAQREACGTFVAHLDGDDHWLPDKVQRQVAFLQAHPQTPLCFHSVKLIGDGVDPDAVVGSTLPWVSLSDLLLHNYVSAPSIMYRRHLLPTLPDWFDALPFADWPMSLLLAQHGPLGFLDEPLAVYRVHQGGVWSGADAVQQADWEVAFLEQVRHHLPAAQPRDLVRALTEARLRRARAVRATEGSAAGVAVARRALGELLRDDSVHAFQRARVLGDVLGHRLGHRLAGLRGRRLSARV
jgi:glycosyltransferase involved in cell wall biosynthesis